MRERAEEFGVSYGAQNRAVPGLHSVPGAEFGGRCGERKMAAAPAPGTAGGALHVRAGLPAEAKTSWLQSLAGQAEATRGFTQFPTLHPVKRQMAAWFPTNKTEQPRNTFRRGARSESVGKLQKCPLKPLDFG